MKFGLDFDGTVTRDPELWLAFISTAKERGHEVVLTTYRSDDGDNADVEAFITKADIRVAYTNARQKTHVEWHVDVWIDDKPELCPTFRELAGQVEYCKVINDVI